MHKTLENGHCRHCGQVLPLKRLRPDVLSPGTTLQDGRYLLGESLGGGGFGITYIGLDTKTDERVAIKEFFPRTACTRGALEKTVHCTDKEKFSKSKRSFLREARTMQRLSHHSGIVHFYAVFEENQTAYIVMELLEGKTLREMVRTNGKMDLPTAYRYMASAADILAYVHSMKVLHRDISPDNIYLCQNGAVKLIDFGASYVDSEEFTQTHPGVKKRGYSPPEQNAAQEKQGPWMDVYALTACLYFCLTGEDPADSMERLYEKDPVVQAVQNIPGLTERQRNLLNTGLKMDYTRRYQNGEQLKRALEETNVRQKTNPPPPEPVPLPTIQSENLPKAFFHGWLLVTLVVLLPGVVLCGCVSFFQSMCTVWLLNLLALGVSGDATLAMCLKGLHYQRQDGKKVSLKQKLGCAAYEALFPFFLVEALQASRNEETALRFQKRLGLEMTKQPARGTKPAPADEPQKPARMKEAFFLTFVKGALAGQQFRLEEDELVMGRDPRRCTFVVADDRRVSAVHCKLTRQGKEYWLQDLHSSNGTFVNSQRLGVPRPLKSGDLVRIGDECFTLAQRQIKEDL